MFAVVRAVPSFPPMLMMKFRVICAADIETEPLLVIVVKDIPVPAETLDTVPRPAPLGVDEAHADPVDVRMFPLAPGEERPVPPFTAARIPLTSVARFNRFAARTPNPKSATRMATPNKIIVERTLFMISPL